MSAARQQLDTAIAAELRAQLTALRAQSYAELLLLPEESRRQLVVLGARVEFTLVRSLEPDQSLWVLLRSDRSGFLGLGTTGTTQGFIALPSGQRRDATSAEVLDFFG